MTAAAVKARPKTGWRGDAKRTPGREPCRGGVAAEKRRERDERAPAPRIRGRARGSAATPPARAAGRAR